MRLDNTCKLVAESAPRSFVAWRLGLEETSVEVSLENIELLAQPLPIRSDSVLLLPDRKILFHVEFQTDFEPGLPFRMLDYYVRLYRRYVADVEREKAVQSIVQEVILLRETRAPIPESFARDQTHHKYRVLKVWEQDGAELLRHEAAIPFAVLARWEGMDKDRYIPLRAVSRAVRRIPDERQRANLGFQSFVLAGLKFKENEIRLHLSLPDEVMRESPIYQRIVAEAEARGEAKGRAEDIVKLLSIRFGTEVVSSDLLKLLRKMDNLEALDALFELAARAQRFDEFRRGLEQIAAQPSQQLSL
ncbi:MAG: hypothetical protein NZ693_01005 [Thermoflexales bacterium]|nr:hypothetical protein [Thermoflexales bacterium]